MRDIPHSLLLHANVINGGPSECVLRILEERGYGFITVYEAVEEPAYDLPDRCVGPIGLSWLQRWLLTRYVEVPSEPREVPWVARAAAGDALPSSMDSGRDVNAGSEVDRSSGLELDTSDGGVAKASWRTRG